MVAQDNSLWAFSGALRPASARLSSIAARFDAQTAQTPDVAALIDDQGGVTYEALRLSANRLTGFLLSQGLARGDVVAVMIDGSRWAIISLLAILKAGGAYAPIDPGYPAARIAAMFSASRPKLALVCGGAAERVPPGCPIVDLGAVADRIDAFAAEPPLARIDPLDIAYVIHTSGSSGQPKGIQQTHRCLANFIDWQVEASGLGRGRRVLQCASPSFDVSVQEILYALTSGGSLYLTDSATRRDLPKVARLIAEQAIEVVDLPFSAINVLFGADALLPVVPTLRGLISAGEPLHVTPALEAFLARNPQVVLHNHYGPAETHMLTSHSLRHGDGVEATPPLGRPIPNTHVFVLDDALNFAPLGEVGEICIGGLGLARGYCDAAMTAERFVPHPFLPGQRLYRSGDLGRWRSTGELEILGRRDDQVKIRGFRVELPEVEAALRRCPGVVHAAVAVRVNAAGGRELCAFVNEGGPGEDDVRAFLQRELPEYMQPARFFEVDRLPLSPNGKIDRRRLEALAEATIGGGGKAAADAGAGLEAQLAQIWSEVLERPVGASDDLFLMGCDSLKAARIAARTQRALGKAIDLRSLFENRTIERFAAAVRQLEAAERPRLGPRADPSQARASDAQLGLWIFDARAAADRVAYNFIDGFWFDGPCELAQLEQALGAVVARHEALRTTLRLSGGRLMQTVHPKLTGRVEILRQHEADDPIAASAAVARALVLRPFDLSVGPTAQAVIASFGTRGAMLLLGVHHAFSDARSSAVVQRDLRIAYDKARRGEPPDLPPLPFQYADFAAWQAQLAAGDFGNRARAFWAGLLAGRPDAASLPRDRDVDTAADLGDDSFTRKLGDDLDSRLRALAGRGGVTLYMWLVVAFAATLAHRLRRRDLVFASVLACRDEPELDDQVGLYANLCLLRVAVEPGASYAELGRQVQALVAGVRTYAYYPFAKVVGELPEAAPPSGGPPFEIGLQLVEHDAAEAEPQPRHAFAIWASRARNPLWVTVEASPDNLSLLVEYDRDLFGRETVAALVDDFVRQLTALTGDPDAPAISPAISMARETAESFVS